MLHQGAALREQLQNEMKRALDEVTARKLAFALLVFSAAVLCRTLLDPLIPDRLPFITFFPALVVSGYCWGLIPSVVVLVLSAFSGVTWFLDPDVSVAVGTAVFLTVGGIVVTGTHLLVRTTEGLRSKEKQLNFINRELAHRNRNLLTLASSVCRQTLRSGASSQQIANDIGKRLAALATAHDFLSIDPSEEIDLSVLVRSVVGVLAPGPQRLVVHGDGATLPASATLPFALVLHELATNAVKFGAWSNRDGVVEIRWTEADQGSKLNFRWHEHGGAPLTPPARQGFGTTMVRSSIPSAVVELAFAREGLRCRIQLPISSKP